MERVLRRGAGASPVCAGRKPHPWGRLAGNGESRIVVRAARAGRVSVGGRPHETPGQHGTAHYACAGPLETVTRTRRPSRSSTRPSASTRRNETARGLRRSLRDTRRFWRGDVEYAFDSFSDGRGAWRETRYGLTRQDEGGVGHRPRLPGRAVRVHRPPNRSRHVPAVQTGNLRLYQWRIRAGACSLSLLPRRLRFSIRVWEAATKHQEASAGCGSRVP